MMFYRINDYTVSCVIGENEIIQMGYQLDQLYSNKEVAAQFMKDICSKAKEIGFHIGDNVQAVQVAMSQRHQMILNFIEVNPEEQINTTIQNLLGAAETVEMIGKDRLSNILHMTGEEKAKEFNACMAEIEEDTKEETDESNLLEEQASKDQIIENMTHDVQESLQIDNNYTEAELNKPEVDSEPEEITVPKEIYMLKFTELSKVEEFCKDTSFDVPGKLYKDRSEYIMRVDLGSLDLQKKGGFIFQAEEYTSNITPGDTLTDYLEEHAEVLIDKKPITILKKL